jgi:signal transduction histidine kinase
MNKSTRIKKLLRFFTLSRLSIQQRLPLLICMLLLIIIVIFAWTSYVGVKNASLEVGHQRLNALTEQLSSLFQTSAKTLMMRASKTANHDSFKDYIFLGGKNNKEEIKKLFGELSSRDTLTYNMEILSREKTVLFKTSSNDVGVNIDHELSMASKAPDYSTIGKFCVKHDSIYYPVIAAVTSANNYVAGYVVWWRVLTSTSKTLKQLSRLIGAKASIYLGNNDGSFWTNMIKPVSKPNINIKKASVVMEYSGNGGEEVLAEVGNVPNIPWLVLVELSKDTVLEPAQPFLRWIIIIGITLIIGGILLAWMMSRNITKPLKLLTAATSDFAGGNYSSTVKIDREDELGKLANAFNTMAIQVRSSQKDLETKVESRTRDLKEANTELEKLNQKLKELDEIKTEFFTNVSHELRTPLALILGPVEKMLSGNTISKLHKEDLKTVQQNARMLLKHVNNLLDLSKLEVGKLKLNYENFDLSQMINITASYFEALAKEQKIHLKINTENKLNIQADAEKIERVLFNLFSNAFKFTPPDGVIECSLSKRESKAIFEIHDSGPGIKPELMDTIFNRFDQTSRGLNMRLGGSGLGLSIVKEFIELHKGNISIKNAEKGGAVFTFELPLTSSPEIKVKDKINYDVESIKNNLNDVEILRSEKEKVKNNLPSNAFRKSDYSQIHKEAPLVLVVEDNIEMNKFICESLSENYNVDGAFDGQEGLKKIISSMPDLIITDIMMPVLSGDELIRKLKSNHGLESTIPIIVLTAKSDQKLKLELLNTGVQDYLSKPFTLDELKARVNNVIKLKTIRDRLQQELKSKSNDISELVEEITLRKNAVESSLKEKEVLLKEIHHRVKNNLQIISSLLNLQSKLIDDPFTMKALRDSQNRVRSMGLIHEKLYQSKDFLRINLDEYVRDLINYLFNSYDLGAQQIASNIKIGEIFINIDKAIPLGLIMNELISNTLKHAFSNGTDSQKKKQENAEVNILINNSRANEYFLVVKDNGSGLPKNFNIEDSQTLGLQLVNTLVDQINGKIEVFNNKGTEFKITFTT